MSITIHSISGATCSWRAMLGFAFKGIEYDVRHVQGSKREHKAPAFLSLNPRGKVPVMEEDDLVLRDSIAILAWLDRAHPQRPLFGATTQEAAAIWQIVLECNEYLQPATSGVVFPVFNGDGSPPEAGSEEAEALNTATGLLDAECRFLEATLGEQPFLCGAFPTAADAVAYPEIGRIQRAIETKSAVMATLGYDRFDERYPNLAAWRERIAALPGVEETVPPHWKSKLQ